MNLPEYCRESPGRLRLGVEAKIGFSNPGETPGVWLKGRFHRWSEDGLTLSPVDAQHQLEARKIMSSKKREVVLKKG